MSFTAKIRDLSHQGLGVADTLDGRVVFVAGAWPGDTAELQIEKMEKRYGFAKLLRLIEASPERQESPCPHQGFAVGQCGGCPWMIATYSSQLKRKKDFLTKQMQRAGLSFEVPDIHPSPLTEGYRNRAQFKTDGQKLGFVSNESHQIAAIEDCLILTKPNRQTLKDLLSQLPNIQWRPEEGHSWTFLDIDEEVSSENLVLNRRRPFQQGNSFQNEFMRNWLKEVSSQMKDPCLELFCGSGNFTEVLSSQGFKQILAVEAAGAAIDLLAQRALPGVTTLKGDLYKKGSWNEIRKNFRPRSLILDPPRAGFSHLKEFVGQFPGLETIVYISCDIPHWIRDIRRIDKEWQIVKLQPLDLFPHTPHLEVLSLLQRKS